MANVRVKAGFGQGSGTYATYRTGQKSLHLMDRAARRLLTGAFIGYKDRGSRGTSSIMMAGQNDRVRSRDDACARDFCKCSERDDGWDIDFICNLSSAYGGASASTSMRPRGWSSTEMSIQTRGPSSGRVAGVSVVMSCVER